MRSRRFAPVLAGLGLVLALGCGDQSGVAKRFPVSGTVSYKGQPVEKGSISFVPTAADGRAANGEIANGKFTLSTVNPGDGALPGSYKVTVMSQDVDTTKLKEISKGGQFHHDETFAKAVTSAKNLVPAKYKLADTSDLKAEVKPESNSFTFDLTD
jgi:hypothetical protein